MSRYATEYFLAARQGTLLLRECLDCAICHGPRAILCERCHLDRLQWKQASGLGRVHSTATFHHAYEAAGGRPVPYHTALVELDEGPRILTSVTDHAAPAVGATVRVRVAVVEDRLVTATLQLIP